MMIQKRWFRRTALAAALALPVLISGCGLFSQQANKPIDPPQAETSDGLELKPTGQAGQQGQETSLTVYLQDRNGYLAPISVSANLGENESAGQKALEMMVENGAYASQLPEDFRAVIPQGTQIKKLEYDPEQKLAKVDFSEPFVDYNSQDERVIVEAITWTLTGIEGIEGVEIYHEGEKLTAMPVANYPMDEPLTRDIGINIELANGVNYSNSSPVTLYFSAETMNDEQYYVPITRLISRSDSPAHAAMEQLIAGPLDRKKLISVIMPEAEVTNIEKKDDLVIIDIEDESYVEGHKVPSEMLQAVVLSLTETTGATAVQIRINGDSNLVDNKNISYSEPVGKPEHVNALKS